MKLKDLIDKLDELQDKYGDDIEVYITGQYYLEHRGWSSFDKEHFKIESWEGLHIDIDLGDV